MTCKSHKVCDAREHENILQYILLGNDLRHGIVSHEEPLIVNTMCRQSPVVPGQRLNSGKETGNTDVKMSF